MTFVEGEVNVVELNPRDEVELGHYSAMLTEPKVNNCFSIFTRSDLNRI